MSVAPLSVGLVGCGRLGEVGYLPALASTSDLRLVAVADPDAARRERVADLAEVRSAPVARFPHAAALLAEAAVEALVLASPAAAHLDDARLAASAGAAVLVEKPPAPDAATAAELALLSPPPWVGFNRRFDAGAQAARAAVPSEVALELELEISYRRRSWDAHSVHDDALGDLGPHLVDWARWLTGSEVVDVLTAQVAPDLAKVELLLARGRARITAAVDRPHSERIEVRDGTGAVVARHRLGGIGAALRDRLAGRQGPHAMITTLARQLEAFAAAVRGAPSTGLGTAADGHAVMAVLDAVRASADQRRPIPVPQPMEK